MESTISWMQVSATAHEKKHPEAMTVHFVAYGIALNRAIAVVLEASKDVDTVQYDTYNRYYYPYLAAFTAAAALKGLKSDEITQALESGDAAELLYVWAQDYNLPDNIALLTVQDGDNNPEVTTDEAVNETAAQ